MVREIIPTTTKKHIKVMRIILDTGSSTKNFAKTPVTTTMRIRTTVVTTINKPHLSEIMNYQIHINGPRDPIILTKVSGRRSTSDSVGVHNCIYV